jgi:hypothetical protein
MAMVLAGQARDPKPEEARWYEDAVKARDSKALFLVIEQHSGIIWGSITSTFSDEDRRWISGTYAAHQRAQRVPQDDDGTPDYFPDEGYGEDGVSSDP